VADNFNLRGLLRWRRLILPAIFPYYITGAITTVGGAWNVTIVAEVVKWGKTVLIAKGVGAYIAEATTMGDFAEIAVGILVMSGYVLILNRILWRPLYNLAERRFRLEG
jgi:NitT/TauT family transport system permease protein